MNATTPDHSRGIATRTAGRRWGLALGVAVATGGIVAGTLAAAAGPGLPGTTPEQLLTDLQQPTAESLSGTIVAKADLGLPALPGDAAPATDEAYALLAGSHTMRVWYDGPERFRLAKLGSASEVDVIRNGADVWTWSSAEKTADHTVLPEHLAKAHAYPGPPTGAPTGMPSGAPSTPAEAARAVLDKLDETTTTTTSTATVAGRDAYELVLTPRQAGTLVAKVTVAVDGETKVPLRVQVYSTKLPNPAYEVGFTSVDVGDVEDRLFTFTPPPGTTVTRDKLGHGEGRGSAATADGSPEQGHAKMGSAGRGHEGENQGAATREDAPAGSTADSVTTVGAGWSTVVVADAGQPLQEILGRGGADSEEAASDLAAMLSSLPRSSGAWGSGRVLSGTLVSAILRDDGRVAVGAVTPEVLQRALAAS